MPWLMMALRSEDSLGSCRPSARLSLSRLLILCIVMENPLLEIGIFGIFDFAEAAPLGDGNRLFAGDVLCSGDVPFNLL